MPAFILLVALSVVANMALGFIWYMPKVFGTQWMRDTHLNQKNIRKETMVHATSLSAVSYAVLAVLLGAARHTFIFTGIQQFLVSAFFAWMAFVLCIRMTHALFEQKSVRYIAITSGHDLLAIVMTATIMYYA